MTVRDGDRPEEDQLPVGRPVGAATCVEAPGRQLPEPRPVDADDEEGAAVRWIGARKVLHLEHELLAIRRPDRPEEVDRIRLLGRRHVRHPANAASIPVHHVDLGVLGALVLNVGRLAERDPLRVGRPGGTGSVDALGLAQTVGADALESGSVVSDRPEFAPSAPAACERDRVPSGDQSGWTSSERFRCSNLRSPVPSGFTTHRRGKCANTIWPFRPGEVPCAGIAASAAAATAQPMRTTRFIAPLALDSAARRLRLRLPRAG